MEILSEGMKVNIVNGNLSLSFAPKSGALFKVKSLLDELLTTIASHNKAAKITIDEYSEPRSLSANAYFHVLVDKIAKSTHIGADECKVSLVLEYGTIAEDARGKFVGVKVPADADIKVFYKYAKYIGAETDSKGNEWARYVFYKETHTLDKKEMARLIEGTVQEAKTLGIETKTPLEIAQMLGLMEKLK